MTRSQELENIGIKLRGFFHYDAELKRFMSPEWELWFNVFMRHIDDYLGGYTYAAFKPSEVVSNRSNAIQFIFSHECDHFGIDRDWFIELCTGAKCRLGLQ